MTAVAVSVSSLSNDDDDDEMMTDLHHVIMNLHQDPAKEEKIKKDIVRNFLKTGCSAVCPVPLCYVPTVRTFNFVTVLSMSTSFSTHLQLESLQHWSCFVYQGLDTQD